MLQINQLHFQYPHAPAILNGVDLQLNAGELLTILGANGRGKSTLLNCIAGLFKPQAGTIHLHGEDLSLMTSKQIAQKIAYVSQHSPNTYQYTVRDFVVLGRAAHLGLFNQPSEEDFALVDNALHELGIKNFANKVYMQLSGGQKQLVNLARILVQQPQLILFDEPTSALDYGNVFKTLSLIRQLSSQNYTIIMTTHNPDHPILLDSCVPQNRVAILNEQGKLDVGSVREIITEQNLSALYHTELKLLEIAELQRQICAIKQL